MNNLSIPLIVAAAGLALCAGAAAQDWSNGGYGASAQARHHASAPAADTFAVRYATARQQCEVYVQRLHKRCLAQTRDHFVTQQ